MKAHITFLSLALASLSALAAGITGTWKAEFDTQRGLQKYLHGTLMNTPMTFNIGKRGLNFGLADMYYDYLAASLEPATVKRRRLEIRIIPDKLPLKPQLNATFVRSLQ